MIVPLLTCLARSQIENNLRLPSSDVSFSQDPNVVLFMRSKLALLRFRFGFVKQHFSFSLFCSFLLNAAVYVQL